MTTPTARNREDLVADVHWSRRVANLTYVALEALGAKPDEIDAAQARLSFKVIPSTRAETKLVLLEAIALTRQQRNGDDA